MLAEPRAWQEGCPPLIPHPLSQRPGKEPSSSVSWASAPLGEQRKGGSADLFNGDGPATPDTVHLALSGLFVPVQVGTLSRLEEKKKRQVRGAQSGRGTAARLEPRPPALPWPGQALVVGRGRGGGAGKELRPRVFQRVYSYTRHHTEQHRSLSGPPLTKEQGHGIPRAREARSPGRWGVREGEGPGEGDSGRRAGREHRARRPTGESQVRK